MSRMTALDLPWTQALAWTLIHFIWQGAAIGLAAFLLLRAVRMSAATRYLAGVVALALMLAAPIVTITVLKHDLTPLAPVDRDLLNLRTTDSGIVRGAQIPESSGLGKSLQSGTREGSRLPVITPLGIVVLWLAGVAVLSARLLGGWLVAQRLIRRAVQPVAPEILALARRVGARLSLDRIVRFVESTAVTVPATIGWLKPVVLLPAAAMTGLSTEQIEALLAHELAHVWRHDYLVNLLQSAVETLLFYHPAVWWASRLVRTEREHCCDDVAIKVCDRLVYATALSDLAAIKAPPRVVMAASRGPLLWRVRRILGWTSGPEQERAAWLPVFVIMLIAGVLVPAALRSTPVSGQQGQPSGVRSGIAGGPTGGVVGRIPKGVAAGIAGGTLAGSVAGGGGGIAGGALRTSRKDENTPQGAQDQSDNKRQTESRRQEDLRIQESENQSDKPAQQQGETLKSNEEDVQLKAELARLESELKQIRDRYEQAKKLVEAGLVSPQALSEIKVELRMLEEKIASSRQGGQLQEQREKLADLSAQLQRARLQLEQARQLFEKGLAGTTAVKEAEAKVTASEKLVEAAKQLQLAETEIQSSEAIRQAEIARIQEALREIGTKRQEELRRTAEQQAKQAIDSAVAAETAARVSAAMTSERDMRLLASSAPVTNPDEAVRSGDLLVIDIQREPDLPRVYVVAESGTIRLPLIGNVPVVGLTVARVRDALIRELTKLHSADLPTVTVTLRRLR